MAPFVGSPAQYILLYAALVGSMLAGASAVHWLLKPDTRLPAVRAPAGAGAGARASGGGGAGVTGGPQRGTMA